MTDLTSQNPINSVAVPETRWRAQMKASAALRHTLMYPPGWDALQLAEHTGPIFVGTQPLTPGPNVPIHKSGEPTQPAERESSYSAVRFEIDKEPGVEFHVRARTDHIEVVDDGNGWSRIRIRGHSPMSAPDDDRAAAWLLAPAFRREWLHETMTLAEILTREMKDEALPTFGPDGSAGQIETRSTPSRKETP